MIIKSDTPERKELTEGDIVGASALEPYLARGVVSVHGGLQGPNSIHPYVGRHLHWGCVNRDAELNNARVPVAASGLGFQPSSLNVGDGVSRSAPWRWRTPLDRVAGGSLANAAGEGEQHDQHGRDRGPCTPPTARHVVENRTKTTSKAQKLNWTRQTRWYIAFRPIAGLGQADGRGPRSSGDRAPPSGGGSASSNLAGGASRNTPLTRANTVGDVWARRVGTVPFRLRSAPAGSGESGSSQGCEPRYYSSGPRPYAAPDTSAGRQAVHVHGTTSL
jgi:hypothetical protein